MKYVIHYITATGNLMVEMVGAKNEEEALYLFYMDKGNVEVKQVEEIE